MAAKRGYSDARPCFPSHGPAQPSASARCYSLMARAQRTGSRKSARTRATHTAVSKFIKLVPRPLWIYYVGGM